MGAIAEAIMGYAQPLIDSTDGSLEQMNKALAIGQLCWNLAVTPEEQRQSALDGMRNTFPMGEAEFDDFRRNVMEPMIRRHEAMFPRLHGREPLAPPQWKRRTPAVPTIRSPAAKPQVGPYDPCPCKSGKKYKFCCARGRG